ncbi:hypothetical protein T4D_3932 [Trichinella pseudospiralis]|uniref:Uncharacterized protein n=1 Tax=Trichinella pseudospiralis TaxID=6337 RepID=A0A0V1FM30_TRIPS|nr:hypothetical protein T4D_3932 [Trichinella pseudospiralis]
MRRCRCRLVSIKLDFENVAMKKGENAAEKRAAMKTKGQICMVEMHVLTKYLGIHAAMSLYASVFMGRFMGLKEQRL